MKCSLSIVENTANFQAQLVVIQQYIAELSEEESIQDHFIENKIIKFTKKCKDHNNYNQNFNLWLKHLKNVFIPV